MFIKKILSSIIIAAFFLPTISFAQEAINPSFDPGFLISDAAFADTGTFGSSTGVQQFLESRGSVLANTDPVFLTKLREPADVALKTALEDIRPNLGRLRTAAELIYDAALGAGLNPQVLIVTLQKEQSLITKNFTTDADLQRALDRALGYGCPDSQPCQASFLSFYGQFFGTLDVAGDRWLGAAKSLSKSFSHEVNGTRVGRGPLIDAQNQAFGSGPFVRASRINDTVIFQNTLGGFAGVQAIQTITLKNFATTALYRYTPHVFNGNYNFWRFYNEWFRYPNGTVIKLSSDSTLWVIDNGLRRTFSTFVAQQRGINISNPIVVSPTEFASYIEGSRYLPKDGTIIKSDAETVYYLIEEGKRRKITDFTAKQRGLNIAAAVTLPQAEVQSYDLGSILLPLENTLIKASDNPTVFMILGGVKRPITYAVFIQRKLNFADVALLPPAEVSEIPNGPLLPPSDGTIVRGSGPAVYLVENGTKRIFSYNVFVQRQYSFASVVVLSDEEMNALTVGLPVAPQDNTLVKLVDHPAIYMVSGGAKAHVTAAVFNLRKLYLQPIMILSSHELDSLPQAVYSFPPANGTLLRASD